MKPHYIRHRNLVTGEETILAVPGERDPGAICNAVRDRLFDLGAEEKRKQAAHADACAEKWRNRG